MNTEFLARGYQAGANVPYNATIPTGLSEAYTNYQAVILEPRFGIVFSPFGSRQDGHPRRRRTVLQPAFGQRLGNIFDNAPNKFSPSVGLRQCRTGHRPQHLPGRPAASFITSKLLRKGFTLSQIQAALGKITFAAPQLLLPARRLPSAKVAEWSFEPSSIR